MIAAKEVVGDRIRIRSIKIEDVNLSYLAWLNDKEVNQYLETKWEEQTIESISKFVNAMIVSDDSILFAIVENQSGLHIGNIKIGPIHPRYRHADISYFIGEKTMWGRGYITEAISLICEYGFMELNLHRIEAGAYDMAVGSWKALEKNGFTREAHFREQVFFENKWIDIYKYGLLIDEWKIRNKIDEE